jgi:hypothetical protein
MFISPHQCDYLSPFEINGKGYFYPWGCSPYLKSPWGCSPYLNCPWDLSPYLDAFDLPLNNISPFGQGISLGCQSSLLPEHVVSTNHGKNINSLYGCVSPYLLYKMNTILPLQSSFTANATAQPEHRSTSQE